LFCKQTSKVAQPRINDLEAIRAKKFKKLKLAATKKSISRGNNAEPKAAEEKSRRQQNQKDAGHASQEGNGNSSTAAKRNRQGRT
jgi:hypothetical protein